MKVAEDERRRKTKQESVAWRSLVTLHSVLNLRGGPVRLILLSERISAESYTDMQVSVEESYSEQSEGKV